MRRDVLLQLGIVGAEGTLVGADRGGGGGARFGIGSGCRLGAYPPAHPGSAGRHGGVVGAQVRTSITGTVFVSGDGSRAPSAIAMRCATASGSANRSKLCTRR